MFVNPAGAALEFDVVMDEDAVVKNRESCFSYNFFAFENRPMENNIIALPLSRFSTGVNRWDGSAV